MIQTLDLAIIGLYFALVFAIGIYVTRRTRTDEDLFLAGRDLPWGLIGLSLFASNISSTTLIGLAGSAYTDGIVNSVFEWGSAIPFVVLAVLYAPLYLTTRITTVPEFLEKRFDRRSRTLFSLITITISIIVDTAGGLYAGAVVLKVFFPNLVLWQTCLVLAFIAGAYTAFGGLKAVVYTDAIQAVILIIGGGALTYILFAKLDFSWSAMIEAAPPEHFSVIKPVDDKAMPWPGLFFAVPFLGFWYLATNQYITQRILAARDVNHARWGLMFGGLLKFLPLFIMVLPGAMMISIMPGIEDGDSVFPQAVVNFLPTGLVGLVLAGLISAIMSSVDSTLNSASTLVVHDFLKPANPDISTEKMLSAGRISTFVFMIVAAAWAPMIENFQGLWSYLQSMFAIIVPPVVILFLLGIFYKRGNGHGAFWTLIIGILAGVILFVLGLGDDPIWPVHYSYNIGICILISITSFVGISLMTAPPSPSQIENYTFRKEMIHAGTEGLPLWKDYRAQSAVLIVIVAVHYIVFS